MRVDGVTLDELFGATIPAGTQLTRVNLIAIDQLNPNASLPFQESDARTLVGGSFDAQTAQPTRIGGGEDATIIVDGQVVADFVPTLVSPAIVGNDDFSLQTDGGSFRFPAVFEIDGLHHSARA